MKVALQKIKPRSSSVRKEKTPVAPSRKSSRLSAIQNPPNPYVDMQGSKDLIKPSLNRQQKVNINSGMHQANEKEQLSNRKNIKEKTNECNVKEKTKRNVVKERPNPSILKETSTLDIAKEKLKRKSTDNNDYASQGAAKVKPVQDAAEKIMEKTPQVVAKEKTPQKEKPNEVVAVEKPNEVAMEKSNEIVAKEKLNEVAMEKSDAVVAKEQSTDQTYVEEKHSPEIIVNRNRSSTSATQDGYNLALGHFDKIFQTILDPLVLQLFKQKMEAKIDYPDTTYLVWKRLQELKQISEGCSN